MPRRKAGGTPKLYQKNFERNSPKPTSTWAFVFSEESKVKVKFLDLRDTGFVSIVCDCGAELFVTDEAIEHAEDYHMSDEQFDNPLLALDVIRRKLSPNLIAEETIHAPKQKR
jgi:hypothetical protein